MKKLLIIFTLFTCSMVLISASCKKDKIGIEALPPATQTGEQTFGCLINGVAFTPKGNWSGTAPEQSNYQYVDGTLYFLVTAADLSNNGSKEVNSVYISSLDIELETGLVIPLIEEKKNAATALLLKYKNRLIQYKTNSINRGELKITRLDEANQIVSGTFWFDAINDKGEKIEVREGRFDMRFTK